jgi:hypothetical protein
MKAQVLDAKSLAGTVEAVTNTFNLKHPAMNSMWVSASSPEVLSTYLLENGTFRGSAFFSALIHNN